MAEPSDGRNRREPGWRPTAALARAVAAGAVLLLAAVLLRRADLVVLAAPLLLGAGIGLAARPVAAPAVTLAGPADALLEGGRTDLVATVTAPDGTDVAAVEVALPPGLEPTGSAAAAVAGSGPVPVGVRARRWGRRSAGPVTVRVTAGHGMLAWPVLRADPVPVTTWPLRDGFEAADTVPRAAGLVGGHRSRRPGEGGDVAGVRPFAPGDRLHRINWRVTARTRELHVTATFSDRDTEVLLVLDAEHDVGAPDSSLDTGVRAAAAIAEHYLRAGDRVALVDLARPARSVPGRNGRAHLVRLLDVLLDARPGRVGPPPNAAEVTGLAAADALVVLLSPLATGGSLAAVAALARSGRSVVAVDTLPPGVAADPGGGDWTALAFRLWRLRRDADLDRLAELGVPVVPWRGAGSLDAVLRDATRAARAAVVR